MLHEKSKNNILAWIAPCILSLVVLIFLQAAHGGEKFVYDSRGKRSPFSLPVIEGHEPAAIVDDQGVVDRIRGMLTGVLWDRERPIAFLVGAEKEVVEIGDFIEGWEIIDIKRRGIVIKQGDRVVDLPIHEEE